MTVAVDPVFPALNNVATRRQADYLEIAVKPSGSSTVVWERIPMVSEFGAYAPATQDAELPLYADASGTVATLKSSIDNGGTIPFGSAAHFTDATAKKILAASKLQTPVVYKAHYLSLEVVIQGQGTIKDKGMVGDANAIPSWAYELSVITAQYVDNLGNVIA